MMNNHELNIAQNNELANDILERHYYQYFRKGEKYLEIFLTGACKANCEYCYLKKNQKSIYPIEMQDEDTIIKNLQRVLNWYIKNKFICDIEIFSAEWLTTPLADKVFDVFYNTFKEVPEHYRPQRLLAADNMQFITNDEQIKKVEYQIERLSSLNILFSLSASVDGKFCDFGRTENDDEFYNKLRDFLVKYDLKIHPMVSATNIKYWKDNRNWWMNNFPPEISYDIMSLEVRNEQWDNESIQHLVNYCDYLVNWNFYNRFNQNKKEFLEYVLCVNPKENSEIKVYNNTYNIISLNYIDTNGNDDKISCSLNHTLNIRLADLSLGLCHRLFYPELTFGKYRIDENDEISDFETTNVSLLILKTNIKKSCLPHCENCVFQGVCPGHCLGSSYENYRNCLVPGMEVCNMYKSKLSFLIYKFYHLGLFDEEIWRPVVEENFNEFRIRYMEDLISSVLGGFGIEKQFC